MSGLKNNKNKNKEEAGDDEEERVDEAGIGWCVCE